MWLTVLNLQFKGFFEHTLSTAVFISCAIFFQFSTYLRHTEFNLLHLDVSFSEIGVVGCSSFRLFFAHTLALHVFKLGVWDENLVLHPKLNAQRGSS